MTEPIECMRCKELTLTPKKVEDRTEWSCPCGAFQIDYPSDYVPILMREQGD